MALYILTFMFWLATVLVGNMSSNVEAKKYLNPPPEYIEYFHFGFREALADSFWLRWIQDCDTCQTYLKPVEYLTPSADKNVVPRHKVCDSSWSFKMLDAVTRLAPKFLMPYVAGASTLAILVEDYTGASVLYERGIKEYPEDWQLLYRAAFHYQFDLKDKVRAAEYMSRAGEHGGPVWLKSLAARLLSEAGELEFAISTLKAYRVNIENQTSKETLDGLDKRIKALEDRLNSTGK